MKIPFTILTLKLLTALYSYGQTVTDSIYNSWWVNKDESIFQSVNNGTFSGTTHGYIQLKNDRDTLVLDFEVSKTTLNITHDPNEMYDKSTKKYSTLITSGKTTLTYEVYALANILTINLNGSAYSIGTIDGASDAPIFGLTFNYCSEKTTEFLTLYVTKPLVLSTTKEIIREQKVNYPEAQKLAKSITLLPGSTLLLTIKK